MLIREIIARIKQHHQQSLSFHDYMELALYHPQYGYYSQPKQKIGKEGDFYTNTTVGSVFGETLADVFAEMIRSLPAESCQLVEFGGGTGALAGHILEKWDRSDPGLLKRVDPVMIEKSPYHKQLQQERLSAFRVQWFDDWESFTAKNGPVIGIVYSNELLDAFPVYLAERRDGGWKEVRIGWNEQTGRLEERLQDIEEGELKEYLSREEWFIPRTEGYRVEVNLHAGKWVKAVSERLQQGYLVTIDYGFLRDELYIPQRRKGTLMCYHNHLATEDPLVQPGERDITAHVNFSDLMEQGEQTGLFTLGFFTQSEFLINGGILSQLQEHQETDPFGQVSKRNRAIRQLIFPGGMGQTFKVLVQATPQVKSDLECLRPKGWL